MLMNAGGITVTPRASGNMTRVARSTARTIRTPVSRFRRGGNAVLSMKGPGARVAPPSWWRESPRGLPVSPRCLPAIRPVHPGFRGTHLSPSRGPRSALRCACDPDPGRRRPREVAQNARRLDRISIGLLHLMPACGNRRGARVASDAGDQGQADEVAAQTQHLQAGLQWKSGCFRRRASIRGRSRLFRAQPPRRASPRARRPTSCPSSLPGHHVAGTETPSAPPR